MPTKAVERATILASGFPCLRQRPEANPFDADALEEWATGPTSSAETCAALFVLGVYDPFRTWTCGRFDLFDAMLRWDEESIETFKTWAQEAYTL